MNNKIFPVFIKFILKSGKGRCIYNIISHSGVLGNVMMHDNSLASGWTLYFFNGNLIKFKVRAPNQIPVLYIGRTMVV